jgi:preprotein translocase subunit SecG
METVIIVVHLMVVIALIALVLLQRSEGGGLGIGGGGGGFMTTRGTGNVLTRSTGVLAAAFFATSILLTIIARMNEPPSAILDTVPTASPAGPAVPGATPGTGQGILDTLEGLQAPAPGAPATPPASAAPPVPAAPAVPATPQVPTAP